MQNREEEFRNRERANWSELVPEITFVLLKCRATRERAHIHEIGEEAVATYPDSFDTYFAGRAVPDFSLILLTLAEAEKDAWRYVVGDWFKGWRLTRKGVVFARDVERRLVARLKHRIAA